MSFGIKAPFSQSHICVGHIKEVLDPKTSKPEAMKFIIVLFSLLAGHTLNPIHSLDIYQIASPAYFTIEGTSTLHDWEMTSSDLDGEVTIQWKDNGEPNIQKLEVSLNAKSLKSGHAGMDKNAYKALKITDFPRISFQLEKIEGIREHDEGWEIQATGSLNIAGQKRPSALSAICRHDAFGKVTFEGETSLLMTDFGIQPPKAVLGTIKTGDEITIKYEVGFKKGDI